MIARQHHQATAGLLQLDDKTVIQLAGIARRRAGIKNIASHDNGVDFMLLRAGQQPGKKSVVFCRAAFAVKILAQMPVGGVKEAHKSSLAKKAWAAVYHLSARGKSASCFKLPDHQTVIFFINLSQK